MGMRKTRTTASIKYPTKLINLVKYPGRQGIRYAYTTSLAWSLPYAQVVHMLIHSFMG